MEIWKEIKGFETLYKISDHGNVYSIRNNKELVKSNTKGYWKVKLCDLNHKVHTLKVHRLVAIAFIENPENKPLVNHIDGNKRNNHISNLEWADNKENITHAAKNGLLADVKGKNNGMAILNEEHIKEIRGFHEQKIFNTVQLAKKYQVSRSAISLIVNRKTWSHI